ncbi:sigma factor-like helix-turn-helix DNA-binding protein [Pedococcus sp. KACC 23699]|uniref:Sigma factor-like helix-turn-helix DNA-binding protein n=1 Tax=Pedococcus sp. KACC 23699 TaxID=3149228 RepID=A0AAU7JX20_9MICO
MAEHVVDRPSFDEYVVARGGDLLRTAWLLVGDDAAALRLVRAALNRARPQWSQLAEHGAGSYDTDLRRFLVQAHLRRRRPGSRADPEGEGPTTAQHGPADVAERTRALRLEPLDALTRVQRVVVVLVLFDGLSQGQVADLLDEHVGSVRRHLASALALLHDRFGHDERGVRGMLESLAPSDPPVDLLLLPEVASAPRWRGLRGWVFAVAALGVAVLVVGLVPRQPAGDARPAPGPPPALVPTALSCDGSSGSPGVPRPVVPPLSAHFAAALVCAETDSASVWSGALPPGAPVTDSVALDSLTPSPRGSGASCPDLLHGPAYRLLLLGRDGSTTTWANEDLACDGWPALAQFYVASAEQAARTSPPSAGFLGCPSTLDDPVDPSGVGPGLRKGTVLVEATACLHPLAQVRPRAIPKFHPVRGNVLGTPELAELNADLARSGSRRARRGACVEGAWRYVIRARTDSGRLVELSSVCGREFAVDGHARDLWPVSADTTSMLRALLAAN